MSKIFLYLIIAFVIYTSWWAGMNSNSEYSLTTAKADIIIIQSISKQIKVDSYLGRRILFDENGKADCFDLANQWLFDNGVSVPYWSSDKSKQIRPKDILSDASLIVSKHKNLMGDYPYQVITNSSELKYGDVVATTKGGKGSGHTAVILDTTDTEVIVVEQDTFADIPAYKKSYPKNHFEMAIRIQIK